MIGPTTSPTIVCATPSAYSLHFCCKRMFIVVMGVGSNSRMITFDSEQNSGKVSKY